MNFPWKRYFARLSPNSLPVLRNIVHFHSLHLHPTSLRRRERLLQSPVYMHLENVPCRVCAAISPFALTLPLQVCTLHVAPVCLDYCCVTVTLQDNLEIARFVQGDLRFVVVVHGYRPVQEICAGDELIFLLRSAIGSEL